MSDVTKELLKALKMATLQNRLDMLMTGDELRKCEAAIARAEASLESGRPTMAVWFGEMPESNEKMNWTAILYRRDGNLMDGVTTYRSEYKDRVRYEADRLRWLIGELEHKPNILAYDAELIVEAALVEPKAHHQEPMTVRLDPNAPCRNALAREGKPYPKSNCQRCGTLMRPGWKCAEGVKP